MLNAQLSKGLKYKNLKKCKHFGLLFTFLFLCILFIFGIELIGLSNKEKNIELRNINDFHFPNTISINKIIVSNEKNEKNEKTTIKTSKPINNVEKEYKLSIMNVMLVDAAANNSRDSPDSSDSEMILDY